MSSPNHTHTSPRETVLKHRPPPTVYCVSSYLSQVPLLQSQVTRQHPQTGTGLGHLSSPEVALFKCYSWDTDKWSIYHHLEIKKSGNRLDWEDGKLVEHKVYNCSEEQFCKNVSKKHDLWCSNSTLRSLSGENLVKWRKIHSRYTGNSSGSNAEMNSQYLLG